MLDEVPLESRFAYRENLEYELVAPLDAEERAEYDREHWGLQPAHVREALRTEAAISEWEEAEAVSYG